VKTRVQAKTPTHMKPSARANSIHSNIGIDPPEGNAVVFGTGLLTLDVVINSDMHETPRLYAGGTCGNVLTILSYLGWRSFPIARLNGDTASNRVLRDLKEWGVDVRYARQHPRASTPIIVHQISRSRDGSPSHKFTWTCPQCGAWLPTYKAVTTDAAAKIAPRLKNQKVFFMDRVSRGALMLAEACVKKGALIVFEPSGKSDPKLFAEALALTHILKYSHDRLHAFADLLKGVDKPALEIETRGRDGLRYRSHLAGCRSEKWQEVAAYPARYLKDSAGAGDWCTAGIIHMLGQEGAAGFFSIDAVRLDSALRLGQAMAAWTCGFEGARGGMYESPKESFRAEVSRMLFDTTLEVQAKVVKKVRKSSRRKQSICPSCKQESAPASSLLRI
jgi:sugar/nucleoside kinase (ribokinase family)